jgi:DNA-binding beta-propeller fold protein YncE
MKYQYEFSRVMLAASIGVLHFGGWTRTALAADPYKIVNSSQTMGTGRIDYVYADSEGRRAYVPRGDQILAFDLDTLKLAGSIPNTGGHGVAVDPKTHHGFSSSGPVTMFDTTSLALIKKITVQGRPDGILFEPATEKVYVLSHQAPNVTVLDAKDGSIAGTIDLGGAPEQGASDERGHVYIDVEDKDNIAVVDAKTLTVTAHYSLAGKGSGPAGLGLDVKNHLLFAMCHDPQVCVVLSADDGKIITTLPLAGRTDGGGFNPNTMEAFSSHGNGTLTIIQENSPTSFEVEPTVQTKQGGKTCSFDTKLNHIIVIATESAPAPAAGTASATPPASPPPAGGDQPAGGRGGGRGGSGGGGAPGFLDVLAIGR